MPKGCKGTPVINLPKIIRSLEHSRSIIWVCVAEFYSHFEVIDTVVMWLDKKVINPYVELPEIAQDVAKIREPTLDLIHFLDFFNFFILGGWVGGC